MSGLFCGEGTRLNVRIIVALDISTMENATPIAPHTEDIRMYLRRETTPRHEELDAIIGASQISSGSGYLNFLIRHASAFYPLERQLSLSGVENLMADWSLRERSSALRQDLATLNAAQVVEQDFKKTFSPAEVLGVLYVLEGSRFGNGMLTKAVEKQNASFPLAFLKHGKGSKLWEPFLLRLNSALYDREEILSGSVLTFNLFLTAWKT